jgi:hypothetical protein
MAQMILSKPLVIIVCMYQELMRWLSRLLNGVAVEHVKGFWLKKGKMTFLMKPKEANPTQHDPHGPDDPLSKPLFIIVCMYQEMMRWLSRLLDGVEAHSSKSNPA